MNAKKILGPILFAYAGAYLFAGWLGILHPVQGLQTTVIFGETYVLLTILLWRAREDE